MSDRRPVPSLLLVSSLGALLGGCAGQSGAGRGRAAEPPSMPAPTVSLRVTNTCLEHKDRSGPQTMECALGFLGDDGRSYRLGKADGPALPLGTSGIFDVTGRLEPAPPEDRYDVAGTIAVDTIAPSAVPVFAMRPDVHGALDAGAVRDVVRAHLGDLAACRGGGAAKSPAEVRITLRYTVARRGAVVGSEVVAAEPAGTPVGQCAADALLRWRFPEPAEPVSVTQAFLFRPRP